MNKKTRVRKKKKKYKKSNAAAIFSAFAVLVIFIFILLYKTSLFEVSNITVSGNINYDDKYIIEKSCIKIGNKVYNIKKDEVIENIELDEYIESCEVFIKFPDKVYIKVIERTENIIVLNKGKYIITDNKGYVLREENFLDTRFIHVVIDEDIIYNIGSKIIFTNITDYDKIFRLIEYSTKNQEENVISKITVSSSELNILTSYGTVIKIDISKDINYQFEFGKEIIKTRIFNDQTIDGVVDFTRGENPIYTDNINLNID